MVRRSALPLLALAALAACGGTPGRRAPVGAAAVAPAAPATLDGTDWSGDDGNVRVNYYFRAGGVLHYRDPDGWWEDGTWRLDADGTVVFVVADGFATYRGRLDGDVLSGTADAKDGASWEFHLTRGTPRQPAAVDLAGHAYAGVEGDSPIELHFLAGGEMEYRVPEGVFADGHWEVDGSWVYLKMDDSGFEYFGSIEGDAMVGNAWSPDGTFWTWELSRDSASAAAVGPASPLEGRVFAGDSGGEWMEVSFAAGGKLVARDAQGSYDGSWRQVGARVTVDLNGGYAIYEGRLVDGTLSGTASNRAGDSWSFSWRMR